jgi:hypothetical protein
MTAAAHQGETKSLGISGRQRIKLGNDQRQVGVVGTTAHIKQPDGANSSGPWKASRTTPGSCIKAIDENRIRTGNLAVGMKPLAALLGQLLSGVHPEVSGDKQVVEGRKCGSIALTFRMASRKGKKSVVKVKDQRQSLAATRAHQLLSNSLGWTCDPLHNQAIKVCNAVGPGLAKIGNLKQSQGALSPFLQPLQGQKQSNPGRASQRPAWGIGKNTNPEAHARAWARRPSIRRLALLPEATNSSSKISLLVSCSTSCWLA